MGKLIAQVALCALIAASVSAQTAPPPSSGSTAASLDLILVLDNSGSMKRNDPHFLTRAVVAEFLTSERFPKDTRVGVVLFADQADLVMPLSPLRDAATRQRLEASLKRLDYSGRFTDTAAAVERALYEVRHQGHNDAQKAVVIMTDGIVDTGDRGRDAEKYRWLTTDLAEAAAKAGARVFGIAFTDRADFQLIQSLGEKTGGDYYRILTAEEVEGAFSRIAQGITARVSAPPDVRAAAPARPVAAAIARAPAPAPAPEAPRPDSIWLWLGPGLISAVVASGFIALVLMRRPRHDDAEAIDEEKIPDGEHAYLHDLNDPPVLSEAKYALTRKTTKIGRMKERPGVVRVDRPTVSVQHAEIRYRNGSFYLVDTESMNKTRIDDGGALQPYTEFPLKDGRVISIADCRFEFTVAGADSAETQVWFVDPVQGLVKPVAKKGQGGNYFAP